MILTSEYVGRESKPMTIEVSARQAMNYAASVGDGNPAYFDDERPGGIIAPPMIAVALTWQMALRFTDFWKSDDFPHEVLAQQVHYSEVLRFHQPIHPGTRLKIVGRVAGIQPHPAGTHLILHFAATEEAGKPVFDEYIGGMLRGVRCEDGGASLEGIPAPPKRNQNGAPVWERTIAIDPLAAHLYDGAADIHFPIHTSPAFAKAVGLPGIIYHGTATLAQTVRELVNREADGDPSRLVELSCLFTGMVIPGSDIRVQVMAREGQAGENHVDFQVVNDAGQRAIRRGYAVFNQ